MKADTGQGRRQFLQVAAATVATVAVASLPALGSCGEAATAPGNGDRTPLPAPGNLAGPTLSAAIGAVSVGAGGNVNAWLFEGSLPGPTVRVRRGDRVQLQLRNQLPEATIVHWHGLVVPDQADGHPRQMIGPGATYDYDFPVVQRAGTYWYHPHAHQQTAAQVHRGLAGFFLVGDDEEDALGLPTGTREVLLVLQDRDADPALAYQYAPTSLDLHGGMLRGTAYGNGVRLPTLRVSAERYRFRVLNASHARVYLLGLDSGAPLTVIGNDGGLLPAAQDVAGAWLGIGERLDFLVDFGALPPGRRVVLKSLPFTFPSSPGEPAPQGMEMELLELIRDQSTGNAAPPLPATLSNIAAPGVPVRDRTFTFSSSGGGGMHTINGLSFVMGRVDVQVPLGEVERWIFVNDSDLPHPVHLHGTQFRIVGRSGGRGSVLPYEAGWKDTALLMPLETVDVLVRFTPYRGVFLLHCHNLQHEDAGMMLNVEVT